MKMAILSGFLFLTAIAMTADASQGTVGRGSLEGTVRDRQTRQLIVGATVLIENTPLVAITDADGRFRLDEVPAGTHGLRVEAPGYVVLSQPDILVSPGRSSALDVEIDRGAEGVSETVVVQAQAFERPPEVTTSDYGMRYEEVRRSAGAIGDINRFVQALPGVVIADDQRNDLVTRGGSPNENLTLVDNVEVPNLNHFGAQGTGGGAISMLNTELLADATFLTGGFPAAFGNRLSSVLDIRLREGNRTRTEVEADVNFAGVSAVVEGPLGSRGSWIATVRRSYLDLVTGVIDLPAVPATTAYQFKGVYDLNAANKLWVVGIGGRDSIDLDVDEEDLEDPSLISAENRGWRAVTGVNWQRLFGKRGYGILGVSYACSHFGVETRDRELNDQVTLLNESRECTSTLKYDASLQVGRWWTMTGGGVWNRLDSDLQIDQPFGVQNRYSLDPTRVDVISLHTVIDTSIGAGHVQVSGPIAPRVTLTFGGRIDRFAFLDATTVSPRAGLSVELTPKLTATASFGRYHQ